MPMSVLERFLRYVTLRHPVSRKRRAPIPARPGSSPCCATLVEELRDIGVADAAIDEHGYVMATIPATTRKADVPVIGFIAHVDTSPEMSGAGVKPIVHRAYDGRDLVLPDDPVGRPAGGRHAVPRRMPRPRHRDRVGHDAVGGRQQGGRRGDHGRGRAADGDRRRFRTGRSASRSRPTKKSAAARSTSTSRRFGARYAYTMDGGARGELEYESFSADAMTVTFRGFNTHPGYAKGRMVNAIKLAARFIDRLPADRLSPETTDGRDGFVHPYVRRRRRRSHVGEVPDPRFRHARLAREGGVGCVSSPRTSCATVPGAAVRRHDRRVVSQHARGARRSIRWSSSMRARRSHARA